jgi:hypothetical protein
MTLRSECLNKICEFYFCFVSLPFKSDTEREETGGTRIDKEKSKNAEKSNPVATWPAYNLTWPDPGSNPGLRGGRRRVTAAAMARPILFQS